MAPVTGAAVLAQLPPGRGCAVVRDGDTTIVATEPTAVRSASGEDAFACLAEAAREGFWVGYLAYDLGRQVERVRTRIADDLRLPDLVLARYDTRLVLEPDAEPYVVGDGPTAALLAQAAWRARREQEPEVNGLTSAWMSSLDRAAYGRAVETILELLDAGDCYQVNLTRRLQTAAAADPVGLHLALDRWNPAPHAALCTFGPHLPALAVVSASPELFLRVDGPRVVTRPIKGTAADRATLAASAKDHAENVMIVDLARNDLGRVCEYGSITVPELCAIESHPGLHHLVSTVEGTLRPGVGLDTLVHATFPPASITGAPKPRVMQAIEDLEPVRRGVYCGAVGWVDGDAGRAELAVAIRTFTIVPGATYLGVGGGIVADSSPDAEWAETELKAARLLAAAAGGAVDAGHPMIIWLDGALVRLEDARISPLDHGLTVGDGVFETMRVYDTVPFAWRRHLDRLAVSASGLGLELPDVAALHTAAAEVIAANGLRDARLRLTVTGGPAPPGSSRRAGSRPVVFLVATPMEPSAPTVDVVVVPWTRNERGATAGLKTISYAANVRALAYAEERGAGEAIFADTRGDLCEATGSNVFVVRDGTLVTPPAAAGCLLGVTRGLLLELADDCKEADVSVDALATADEAFLSSTTREVQPIAHVDGVALPAAPGPVATALASAFRALVARDLDP